MTISSAVPTLPQAGSGPAAPKHVAIIMDGNGRWARSRGLPRAAGHRAGAQAVRRTVEAAMGCGVEWLTIYAFSSENWRRSPEEVLDLTGLIAALPAPGARGDVARGRASPRARQSAAFRRRSPVRTGTGRAVDARQLATEPQHRALLRRPRRDRGGRQGDGARDRGRRADRRRGGRSPLRPDALHRRHAGSRHGHPHLRRAAPVQLPAYGSRPMPSWCSSTCCGRISAAPISNLPSPSSPGANGDLVAEPSRSAGSTRWSDLRRRVVSASLLAPIVLACIWFGSAPFVVLIMLGAIGLTVEWVALCRLAADKWPGLLLPVLVVVSGTCAAFGYVVPALLVLLAGGAMMWWAVKRPLFASGILYVGLALVALLWLRGWSAADGRRMVFFVVLVVWASDIGAYVAGRLLRGPKLAPSLSPAKTWSGAVGGLDSRDGGRRIGCRALEPGGRAVRRLAGDRVPGGGLARERHKAACRHQGLGTVDPGPRWSTRSVGRPLGRRPGRRDRRACKPGDIFLTLDRRTVSVLGSTGSIGTSTVDLLLANPDRFRVRALAGGRNVALLAQQARRLGAEVAVIADPALACPNWSGSWQAPGSTPRQAPENVVAAATLAADWTMAAITGAAGLPSTLAAIRRGGAIALANKEALVCAGDVMLRAVAAAGATLAAGRFRAQRHFPGHGGGQRRRRRTHRPDRIRRTHSVPRRPMRWPARRPKRPYGIRPGPWAPRSASTRRRCSTRAWS